MSTQTMILRSFHITQEQDRALTILAKNSDRAKSDLVREGIEEVLKLYQQHNVAAE